jgi:hypothetical protein
LCLETIGTKKSSMRDEVLLEPPTKLAAMKSKFQAGALPSQWENPELARALGEVIEVPQPDTPRLDIRQFDCAVEFEWPLIDERFELEFAYELKPEALWLHVPLKPTRTPGGQRIRLPGSNRTRYVRLRRRPANARTTAAAAPSDAQAVAKNDDLDALVEKILWYTICLAAGFVVWHHFTR